MQAVESLRIDQNSRNFLGPRRASLAKITALSKLCERRGAATFDLILCSNPAIVSRVSVLPGMSGHCTIVSELNLCTVRKPPEFRNKHVMYDQGNTDATYDQL